MARLIDADALYEQTAEWEARALAEVKKVINNGEKWERLMAILNERTAFKHDIADAPTINAEPVKYGKWEEYLSEGLRWKCSLCESRFVAPYIYCPHCGARMDEEDTP